MQAFQGLIVIALSAYAFYFMRKVSKETRADSPLTKNEKIQVIILMLLNTLISWAIFYFGCRNKLPTKAKQVKRYFLTILGVLVGIGIIAFIAAFVLISLSKQG